MSKMNKIITNNSVQLSESEVNNLIVTLGPVIEAFTGGGGGQGSVIYTPGDDNISINNTQHTIALSTDAATKLNTPIPTKVSDLTDSANYATEQYVQAVSAEVTGWVNNQNYLTQVPDTYYLKTETSGKDEISAAFSNIPAYILAGDSNITATSAQDGKDIKWNLAINAHPTVTDTTLTGERGIYTHTTNVSGQWCVELVQSAYDAINDVSNKLDNSDFTTYTGTTAPATYQPKGDYATEQYVQGASADVTAWVNNQNYLKTVPSEYITETELSTALTNYVTSSTTAITGTKQYALTTTGWAEIQAGSTFTGVTTTGSISGGGVNNDIIGLLTSAENALADISNKVDKPDTTQESLSNKYLVYSTLTGTGEVTGWTDFNANVYSKIESDGRYVATADVGSGLYYSGSSPKLGVKLGTDLVFDTNGFVKVDTNGVATGTYAFVEGESNTANGNASHAEGFTNNIINSYSHGEGRNNTEFGGNTNHLEGGYNKVNSPENGGYVHIEGEANEVTGHSIHMEGAFNIFNSTSTADRGISIEGYANATTANNTSVHGGILKVIGNGERINSSTINRSDAYILYHDGTVSANNYLAAAGPVPKSVPNTGDNTMVVQKMFVCTSDADIVAHAALANGEGCIFFRVG